MTDNPVIDQKPVWRVRLDDIRRDNPRLHDKMVRYLMGYLNRKKLITIEDLERLIMPPSHELAALPAADPNRPAPRTDMKDWDLLSRRVLELSAQFLPAGEINAVLHNAQLNEMALELGKMAENSAEPYDAVVEYLRQYHSVFEREQVLQPPDVMGTRVGLIRRFISDQLEYLNVAKHYLTIPRIRAIVERIVAGKSGAGRIGGKGAGLVLAYHILEDAFAKGKLSFLPKIPRTCFVRSDGVLQFMEYNNIQECTNIKYRELEEINQEYPILEKLFKGSSLPPVILDSLSKVLQDFQDCPLVVRSSSLLEDRAGSAFSGKYKSLFVANQGPLAVRLAELTNAMVEVYASTFSPDPLMYRRDRGLLDFQEEMGLLIQEVVGNRVGPYFFPVYAGVAFSKNEIRWSPRIRRDDGVVRLVLGLGTRAVDRTYDDYACLMSPGQPNLRANARLDEAVRYSQRLVDVIDLETRQFETIPLHPLFEQYGEQIPHLNDLISLYDGTRLAVPVGSWVDGDPRNFVVTFEGLLQRRGFPAWIKRILEILAEAYGCPVDLEFASDGRDFYLLQCRTLTEAAAQSQIRIPADVPADKKVFTANRFIQNGLLEDISHIVYIDPLDYEQAGDYQTLLDIGRAVGMLNRILPRRHFILMGPGRWGSRGDIKLGVRVTYADINLCAMLIEIARQKGGYLPEVSFGTHFFQDLVEADIRYLPLYPDDPAVFFHEAFLRQSPNALAGLLPEYAGLAGILRVIDIPAVSGGLVMHIAMDGDAEEALAFLAPRRNPG